MAELGAAASAVGIASLGIQVCQGVLQYYNDWKGYEEDIATVCSTTIGLRESFGLLSSTLECLSLDPNQESKHGVQICLLVRPLALCAECPPTAKGALKSREWHPIVNGEDGR